MRKEKTIRGKALTYVKQLRKRSMMDLTQMLLLVPWLYLSNFTTTQVASDFSKTKYRLQALSPGAVNNF